jgi:hypothetical protein
MMVGSKINRRHGIGFALAVILSAGPVVADAPASQVSPIATVQNFQSPAARAADLLRADKDRLVVAAQAADKAAGAAERALAAAGAAERAAAEARLAAEKAVAAAQEAKQALTDAQATARHPRAPLPDRKTLPTPAKPAMPSAAGNGKPEISPNSPAARAFRALSRQSAALPDAAEAAGKKPPPPVARTKILRVGKFEQFRVPSEAARKARDGDIVEIAAGDYFGDVAVWKANNLTIRGVGGRPHLHANGNAAQGKAIWVIGGDDTVVENIEFSGAKTRGRNGAGIRLDGTSLTIRNSYFHHNQMGLLTGVNPKSDVVIENSEFAFNVVDLKRKRPLGHNIYVGAIRSFTLRNSYVHHAAFGHNVKSRAATNHILYNRLADEGDGRSSYIVDLPNGGIAYLIGNVIQQSSLTDNWSLVNFGSKTHGPSDRLYLANNTLVSERKDSRFVSNRSPRPAILVNNILVGRGKPLEGPGQLISNLMVRDSKPASAPRPGRKAAVVSARAPYTGNFTADHAGFADHTARDYRLTPYSPAIDIGRDPGNADGVSLVPRFEFGDRMRTAERRRHGPIDLGAFEFVAN